MTEPSTGPLAGFVVLDVSRVLSGPYCTMMLRDLGALVIKVEEPGGGDEARHFLPLSPSGDSAYFAAFNRGKKSIALDLKSTADRAVFERLLARADVLVENFRPGVLDKLGYGYTVLEKMHPSLVLASISGFGQTGPYRSRPAYDVVVQAMSGMMSITGHPGGPPVRCGSSVGDLSAALFACNGIQAALLQRTRTGRGCHVDVAMLEAQVALLEGAIPELHCTGSAPGPMGAGHPGTAPFDAFRAADAYVVIAAGSDHKARGRQVRRRVCARCASLPTQKPLLPRLPGARTSKRSSIHGGQEAILHALHNAFARRCASIGRQHVAAATSNPSARRLRNGASVLHRRRQHHELLQLGGRKAEARRWDALLLIGPLDAHTIAREPSRRD